MRLILLGAPGSGKGTQAKLLTSKYGVLQVSTGDILRDHIARKTDLGKMAEAIMNRGELVPDDVMLPMVDEILDSGQAQKGFVFDGFPRTVTQAEGLDTLMQNKQIELDAVIKIEVLEDEVVNRLSARWSCPNCGNVHNMISKPPQVEGMCDVCGEALEQRDDDKPETVRNRIAVYSEQTEPLIDFYIARGKLKSISGDGGIETVSDRLLSYISSLNM